MAKNFEKVPISLGHNEQTSLALEHTPSPPPSNFLHTYSLYGVAQDATVVGLIDDLDFFSMSLRVGGFETIGCLLAKLGNPICIAHCQKVDGNCCIPFIRWNQEISTMVSGLPLHGLVHTLNLGLSSMAKWPLHNPPARGSIPHATICFEKSLHNLGLRQPWVRLDVAFI
ncbi:hypothetical protein VNO77_34486 [Canavalia gladiata]|uniref:Uncharacterized protein n=1 Tax=Canavalia gladiata TaxID=3824 RepID=A0AAN9PZU3_CANGL